MLNDPWSSYFHMVFNAPFPIIETPMNQKCSPVSENRFMEKKTLFRQLTSVVRNYNFRNHEMFLKNVCPHSTIENMITTNAANCVSMTRWKRSRKMSKSQGLLASSFSVGFGDKNCEPFPLLRPDKQTE